MEISEAGLPDDTDAIVDLVVTRSPQQDRALLRADLDQATARSLRVLVAREHDGAMAGVGVARTSSNLPAGGLLVFVCTRVDLGGQGLGSRLYAGVLTAPDDDVTRLVACVLHGDETSLDVAKHWGFEHVQLSVTTSCDLTDAVMPEPPDDVTFEACDDLHFGDTEAVEAMLLASQTNPEFELGLVLSLAGFRETPARGQRPVAVLTRVDGHPSAISFAVADGEHMHVTYTGVDPSMRGRGLGRLTKAFLHAHARDLGIVMALTDNDESNAGIRHLNDQLGYARHSAWYWLMRPRP